MSRRIFRIVIAIAIIIWVVLFMTKETMSKTIVITISALTFLVFSFGIQGLIAHSMRPPRTKGELMTFPLFMWVLWAIMFLIFVFLITPVFYPDFLLHM